MGTYQNGNSVIVDETFYVETVPGDFSTAVPTDPTTVTFYTRDPDGNLVTYLFGVAAEVTNPSVGNYLLELDASLLTLAGDWFYRVQGTGSVVAAAEGEFTIEASSVLVPVQAHPQLQVCQAWCDPQDVALIGDTGVGSQWSLLLGVCESASQLLYELSGERFNGVCPPITARPCSSGCGCWGDILSPLSPGAPQVGGWNWGWWGAAGWGWGYEGCGDVCGCGPLSRVNLSGYPVVEITEVKIDGDVIDPSGYRLDEWEYLTRLADLNGNERFWPGCQRLDLPDTEENTWSVTYRYGQVPPISGRSAAAQLAFQLYQAGTSGDCALPPGVTKIDRQGITIERAPFVSWAQKDGQWQTGLLLVDIFLAAYNPSGLTRPTTIWSPDVQQDAKVLG